MSISIISNDLFKSFNSLFYLFKEQNKDISYSLIREISNINKKHKGQNVFDIGDGVKIISLNIQNEISDKNDLHSLNSLLIDEYGKEIEQKYDVHIILNNVTISDDEKFVYVNKDFEKTLDKLFLMVVSPKDTLNLCGFAYKFELEDVISAFNNVSEAYYGILKNDIITLKNKYMSCFELFIYFLFYFKSQKSDNKMMFFRYGEELSDNYMSIMTNEQYGKYVICSNDNGKNDCVDFTDKIQRVLSSSNQIFAFKDFIIIYFYLYFFE